MSDLVERLLAEQILQQDEYSTTTMRRNPDGPEAAACITELETALAEAGKQLRENAETLAQVPAAIAEARRQALEEAAKVAEELEVGGKTTTMEWANCMAHARDIAQAIRALASYPLLDRHSPSPPSVV